MALRFTPTGVGTTSWRLPAPLPKTVHPHGRGDHATVPISSVIFAGSPPRAWGPPDDPLHEGDVTRFTPTGVGTTASPFCVIPALSVHPHGRGDHCPSPRPAFSTSGSPPRAWGPH